MPLISSAICLAMSSWGIEVCIAIIFIMSPWTLILPDMKACIPAIRAAGGGAVVNTSSTAAIVGTGHSAAYHSAMAGVLMLTRTAAIEYAGENIRINAVLPGPIDPSLLAGLDEGMRQTLLDMTPMKRLGRADEIANAYVFLASDLATFVTGTGLVVDGGFTAA